MISTLDQLHALYGTPRAPSLAKVARRITPSYRRMIEASPFCALATVGPEGADCSPRGDAGQAVMVHDAATLAMPDRRGNNRIDSLRNIVRDPRVALMCLIPGAATILRVNGRGVVSADPALLERYAHDGKLPRSVLLISIDEMYFQCARAVMRAGLWAGNAAPDLPSAGDILAEMTDGAVGGEEYDKSWPERAAATMW